jgi:hypothetical protein
MSNGFVYDIKMAVGGEKKIYRIIVRVPESTWLHLRWLARKHRATLSNVVRRALAYFLARLDGYFAQLGRRLPDRIEHRQDLVGHRRNRFRQKQVKARASPNPTGQSALHPELRLNGQSRSFVKSGISD